MKHTILITLITICSLLAEKSEDKVLTMGYRTTKKLPYIAAAPDNRGLYYDLYSEACRRIGYRLDVKRLPKKRVLLEIEEGVIDFYPGFSFTLDRARYAFWVRNGLQQRDVAISLNTLHNLETIADLSGLKYLVALGNPDYFEGEDLTAVNVQTLAELDVERALHMLKLGRVDFYVYEEDTMKFFIKSKKLKGYTFHPSLIKRFYWMKAGFSRYSPHFVGIDNRGYDSSLAMSYGNFPYELEEGTTIDLFRSTLQDMYEEGYTDSLYQHYFE